MQIYAFFREHATVHRCICALLCKHADANYSNVECRMSNDDLCDTKDAKDAKDAKVSKSLRALPPPTSRQHFRRSYM